MLGSGMDGGVNEGKLVLMDEAVSCLFAHD